MQRHIALVDCNSFYASCECVFRPDLWDKPVGVLSNNDGCFIARNRALKALGVKMGTPFFQVAELVKKHNIQVFSSNFAFYADMSARVMSILETYTPNIEIYSIDEAFLDLTGVYPAYKDPTVYGLIIKKQVSRSTGIPVCVGIGPSKTLAKLANFSAKKWEKTGGVVDLSDPIRREKLMKIVPVGEVWGIGKQTTQKLNSLGVYTVWDLAVQPISFIQKQFSIVTARTVMELNGVACMELEEIAPDKQQIVCSRSFSRRLTQYDELASALSEFSTRVAEKLRKQSSMASCITVFIRTSPFNQQEPQYGRSASVKLANPTQDTSVITVKAKQLLKEIFKSGYNYQKCGVQLSDIQAGSQAGQLELFEFFDDESVKEKPELMQALDKINHRFPKGLVLASNLDKSWKSRVSRMSQRYTTSWDQLATVKA